MSGALFLDKDGTLVHDLPHNVDPKNVRLRSDAGVALRRLQRAGLALVLVTNQSGIAHGLFSESDLERVWERIVAELSAYGVVLDAIYYCPHDPDGSVPRYARRCDCRKPQPGLLLRAAARHGFDFSECWLIGDILDDIEAGNRAGCRTVLLDVGSETEWRTGPFRSPCFVASTLTEAAEIILGEPARVETQWIA